MKKGLLLVCGLLAAVGVYAQGTVNFNNRVTSDTPPINAPVTLASDGSKLAGPNWVAQLYAGPAGTAESGLTAVSIPSPFKTGALAGYFGNPTVAGVSTAPTITGIPAGGAAAVQVRVWNLTEGATYEAALGANGPLGTGKSSILALTKTGDPTASPPGLPGDLIGLSSFTVTGVPEPSVLALGAIGAVGLLLRRRKQ